MRIIGIDPGTAIIGYGIIDTVNGKNILVDYGVITTSPKRSPELRLLDLYVDLNGLL
ncbi:MAG: crossover junction endodeoxyribonuclease RuvC, partial [Armatimonadetes bacterium]|nr:crossover junction endodeoxyribonuclease RuvC [Candidatus Hippobium faecium]